MPLNDLEIEYQDNGGFFDTRTEGVKEIISLVTAESFLSNNMNRSDV